MILGFTIIVLLVRQGSALTCLQCDGVSHPRHCRFVADCFDDEVCAVERVTNVFGQSAYNVGCAHTSKCSNVTDTGSCHECCNSNLCNAGGCGEIGYPFIRGPVCYHCPVQVDINKCGTIEFCEQGEVCAYTVRKEFGDFVYSGRCSNRHTCTSTGISSATIVGRDLNDDLIDARAPPSIDTRTVKDVVCGGCCDGDICNKGCNGTDTAIPTSPCDSHPCEHGICFNQHNGYVCVCDAGYEGKHCNIFIPTDCYDIKTMNLGNTTGVYGIHLWRTHQYLEVLCEMDIAGGGWTVFQHRFDGSENFNQSFDSYTKGFGNASGEYWLGLENIYQLANRTSDLRIELLQKHGNESYQIYHDFSLKAGPDYSFNYSSSDGTAGNGLEYSYPFSTYDNEQDIHSTLNCAERYGGGWWYEACRGVDLNAPICDSDLDCWRYHSYFGVKALPLKTSMMMLRRV